MNAPWSDATNSEPPPLPTSVPDPVHPDSPIAFLICTGRTSGGCCGVRCPSTKSGGRIWTSWGGDSGWAISDEPG